MYKAVISDLDGTLLSRGHHVTKFTKDVIKEIINKGINFYIASGRSYDQIGYITEQLDVKIPIIAANGARIFDAEGKMIYEKGLSKETAEAILDLDYENIAKDSHLNIFSGNDWIITKGTAQKVYDRISRDVKVVFKEIPKDELKNLDILKIFYRNNSFNFTASPSSVFIPTNSKSFGNNLRSLSIEFPIAYPFPTIVSISKSFSPSPKATASFNSIPSFSSRSFAAAPLLAPFAIISIQ